MYDTIYGILKGYNDTAMTIHHVFSCLTVLWCYYNNKYGQEMVFSLAHAEFTGAIFNLNAILKNNQYPESITSILDIVFIASFIILRTFVSSWVMINIQLNRDTDFLYKINPTVVWYLSMDWCWMMVNKAAKIIYNVRIGLKFLIFLG